MSNSHAEAPTEARSEARTEAHAGACSEARSEVCGIETVDVVPGVMRRIKAVSLESDRQMSYRHSGWPAAPH